ncbi:MAG TPA: hypothetical protein EYN79_07345 [Planctomycetes bacterium]|nr:hypothetical protein [Planctomycetota bacterium]HIN79440.1 hypothetical protein [Planctomycetota bacterium]
MIWLLTLLLSSVPAGVADEPTRGDADQLRDRIHRHLSAVREAGAEDFRHDSLILRIEVYPDAFEVEGLERLEKALGETGDIGKSIDKVREDRRALQRLKGIPGFRLTLSQPEGEKGELTSVFLLPARLSECLTLQVGGKKAAWKPWGVTPGLTPARIRVAQFETIRNRKRVPYIRPMKPDPHRLVLESKPAEIRGLLKPGVLGKKRTPLEARLSGYHHYLGTFDGDHLLDLNGAGHSLERDLESKISRSLPPATPPLPDDLQEWLERISEKKSPSSQLRLSKASIVSRALRVCFRS